MNELSLSEMLQVHGGGGIKGGVVNDRKRQPAGGLRGGVVNDRDKAVQGAQPGGVVNTTPPREAQVRTR